MRKPLRLLVSLLFAGVPLIPRRLRYPAAFMAANVSAVALAIFQRIARRRPRPFRALQEHCLARVIGELDVRRLEFDPRIVTVGLELITGTESSRKGVLVATTHANAGLSRVILRVLHDRGMAYEFLSAAPAFPVCGAACGVRPIAPSGMFLLTIRKHLRANAVVLAMLDSAVQTAAASVAIESDEGSFWISEPILHVARRTAADVVFMRGSLQRGTIVIEFARGDASHGPTELARDLGAFALGAPIQMATS
ncbi:MAG TPA: hypothetical protein VE010_13920 [Thermoanaerobaculia bacterium]|nr:hypothetical protein [Thermoanaerobaculia bacterium]